MKIKMKYQVSGTRDGQDWPAIGEELTVPDEEGAELCASGIAEPVTDRRKPETRKS